MHTPLLQAGLNSAGYHSASWAHFLSATEVAGAVVAAAAADLQPTHIGDLARMLAGAAKTTGVVLENEVHEDLEEIVRLNLDRDSNAKWAQNIWPRFRAVVAGITPQQWEQLQTSGVWQQRRRLLFEDTASMLGEIRAALRASQSFLLGKDPSEEEKASLANMPIRASSEYLHAHASRLLQMGALKQKDVAMMLECLIVVYYKHAHNPLLDVGQIEKFFRMHLSELIQRGIFTHENIRQLLRASDADGKDEVLMAYQFIRELYDMGLRESGVLSDEDVTAFLRPLISGTREPCASAYNFAIQHLESLVEDGIFQQTHLAAAVGYALSRDNQDTVDLWSSLPSFIEKNIVNSVSVAGMIVGLSPIPRLLEDQLPLLIEHGLVDELVVAAIAYKFPQIFIQWFHRFHAAGWINATTLKYLYQREKAARDLAPMFAVLGTSPAWLRSVNRWKQVLSLLSDDELEAGSKRRKRAAAFRVMELAKSGLVSGDAEAVARWIAFADATDTEDMNEIVAWWEEVERVSPSKFQWTAEYLGVAEDPRFLELSGRVKNRENWFYAWTMEGLLPVWDDYRKVADPREKRRARNAFINFLETQLKREEPSHPYLWVRIGRQIVREGFRDRLAQGADAEALAALDVLYASKTWRAFVGTPLHDTFACASGFMKPLGLETIRRYLLNIRMEDGRVVYPRYENLRGVFSDVFLAKWMKNVRVMIEGLPVLEGDVARQAFRQQVLHQVGTHMRCVEEGGREKEILFPDEFSGLVDRVRQWHADFSAAADLSPAIESEARDLFRIFSTHYYRIRNLFGNVFGNIYHDLKNFLHALDRGPLRAQRYEACEFTDDQETMSRMGKIPGWTCQILDEPSGFNEEGQPIERMTRGQFKVANWIMDDEVVARHLLETTLDHQGRENLLVERIYIAGGFGRILEFRAQILAYAASLGISEDRVHFADNFGQNDGMEMIDVGDIPKPMSTGGRVYRDTFRERVPSAEDAAEERVAS